MIVDEEMKVKVGAWGENAETGWFPRKASVGDVMRCPPLGFLLHSDGVVDRFWRSCLINIRLPKPHAIVSSPGPCNRPPSLSSEFSTSSLSKILILSYLSCSFVAERCTDCSESIRCSETPGLT